MKKTIRVKTLYNGQIAFPEKFYRIGAVVAYGREKMRLTADMKPTGYSKYMTDHFGREDYRLIYFTWKPDPISGKAKKVAEAWEKYNNASPYQQYKLTH